MKVVRPLALGHELKRAKHPHQLRSTKVSVAVETGVDFLRKVLRTLKPDPIAVTVEFVPSLTSMFRATFALAVLVLATEVDACTFARLEEMFQRAGFWQHAAGARAERAARGNLPEVTARVSGLPAA